MTRVMPLLSLLLVSGAVMAEAPAPAAAPPAKPVETREVVASADDPKQAAAPGPKVISGMSILGNQEAPKSLVIVPWKSSEIGDSVGIATLLDDSRRPVDRDVFARELAYYQIKAESK
ncbi:MAG TPA: hypothetical protein VD737_09885 [Steroidobacteraceae bacterium]|nr:hypothetical protein [Steroidobacteraceae bacterium]